MPCGQNKALLARTAGWLWAAVFSGFCLGDAPPRPPADLPLSPAEQARAEALAQFAWGIYLQMGSRDRLEEALGHLAEAVRLDPAAVPPLQELLGPLVLQKQWDRVTALLEPLVRDHPAVPHLNMAYAEALQQQQRDAEAREHLRRTLEAGGWSEPDVLKALFVALWQERRHDECEKLLARARRQPALRGRFPVEFASAVFFSALRRAEDGERPSPRRDRELRERALEHARRAAAALNGKSAPDDVRSLTVLLFELKEPALAAEALARRRAERGPDAAPEPELLLLEARALQEAGQAEQAAALIDRLRESGGLGPQLYADMADLYADAGRLTAAAEVYEDALSRFPEAAPIRFQLALIYLRLKDPDRGLAVLAPLKQMPPQGRRLLAHLYHAQGQDAKALEELQKAEEAALAARDQAFFTADLYLFAGSLCEDMGKPEAAIEYGRKALAVAPDDPATCNFLGYVLADHNQSLHEAEALILRAVEQEPENEAYLDSLAWVYYRQNRFPEAHEAMNRAVLHGFGALDGVILDHAGDICQVLGLRELALWYWEEAVRAGVPGKDTVRAKIEALRSAAAP